MEKSSMRVKVKNSLLIVFVSVLFLSACATHVSALPDTMVAVNPSTVTIDEVGGTGTVNITVTDVTDLYTWEIRLYFDNATLNFTAASYPSGHVFDGKVFMPVIPVVDADENGTYVSYGCTIVGAEPGFTGNGTLCQLSFTGIALGSSNLTFGPWPATTYLLDSWGQDISFDVTGGEITVIPEFPTFAIIPLFMILTLVAVMIAKRKWSNKR